MGLDVYVKDYEYISEHLGSYTGFTKWRKAIAKAKGFDLYLMSGFGGEMSWERVPFQLILNHSDCDGGYTVYQIPELLRELDEIKKLNVDDYDQTNKLIRLCKFALKTKSNIIFG